MWVDIEECMENISRETARGIRVSRGGYGIVDEIRVAHGPFNTGVGNISTEWG